MKKIVNQLALAVTLSVLGSANLFVGGGTGR